MHENAKLLFYGWFCFGDNFMALAELRINHLQKAMKMLSYFAINFLQIYVKHFAFSKFFFKKMQKSMDCG